MVLRNATHGLGSYSMNKKLEFLGNIFNRDVENYTHAKKRLFNTINEKVYFYVNEYSITFLDNMDCFTAWIYNEQET